VSKNTALQTLDCYNNQLTLLDVSKNTALQTLECYNNQLTSLDVSKNTALKTLRCFINQLASLDVSKSTLLQSLYCSDNRLISLDVSKNTALQSLNCGDNGMKTLRLSKAVGQFAGGVVYKTGNSQIDVYVNGVLMEQPDITVALAVKDCVKLTWGAVDNATAYELYRSDDGGKTYNKIATKQVANLTDPNAPNFTDTDVSVGSHIYSIRVHTAAGLWEEAGEVSVEADTFAAPAVTAEKPTMNSVKVSWNEVKGAQSYKVFLSKDGGLSFEELGGFTKLLSRTYNDVLPGSYIYAVRAYTYTTPKENSSDAGTASVAVGVLDAPVVSGTNPTANSVKLTWNAVAGATFYRVYRSNDNGKSFEQIQQTLLTARTYTDVPAGSYIYIVRAYSGSNASNTRSAASNEVRITVDTLSVPAVTAAKPTANSIKLTWNAVAGAMSYRIWRSADGGKSFEQVTLSTKKTDYTYYDVPNGTYIYAVRAYSSPENRSDAGTASVTVSGTLTAPSVSYSKPTANSVKLTWTIVSGATSYQVFRSDDGGKNYTSVVAGTTDITWTDTNVPAGSYIYAVRAHSSAGRSGAGTTPSITI
jgi:fibronectin type 3 domain-containing protein